jgi:hypothetical protein
LLLQEIQTGPRWPGRLTLEAGAEDAVNNSRSADLAAESGPLGVGVHDAEGGCGGQW